MGVRLRHRATDRQLVTAVCGGYSRCYRQATLYFVQTNLLLRPDECLKLVLRNLTELVPPPLSPRRIKLGKCCLLFARSLLTHTLRFIVLFVFDSTPRCLIAIPPSSPRLRAPRCPILVSLVTSSSHPSVITPSSTPVSLRVVASVSRLSLPASVFRWHVVLPLRAHHTPCQ